VGENAIARLGQIHAAGCKHTPLHNFAMREEPSADAMTPTLMSHLHAYTQLVRGRYEGARSSMTGSVVANGAD
jgi:hypothetical protein